MAVLPPPVVLNSSTLKPTAVFSTPLVLFNSAEAPMPVSKVPVVLYASALKPTAVLLSSMLFKSASSPKAVFWFVKQPS